MSSFSKCYDKYFRWNDGLLKHFFSKGRNDIQFHVDEHLLEEIGQENGISADDFQSDFISSVEAFCASYNEFVCPKQQPNAESRCPFSDCKYYSNIYCLTRSKREDVLAVANHICTKGMVYYEKYLQDSNTIRIRLSEDSRPLKHHLPFLAIVIYVILKFDNGKTQEWANVGPCISPVSRTFIPVLWEEISKYDPRFDKDASVFDSAKWDNGDYAGRILYHLPLSASTRNKIQDAIYKSSAWKLIDSKSFLELVALIEQSLKDDTANEELKAILSQCFSINDYKGISARRVQAVINDFDIDTYEKRLEERKQSKDFEQTRISGEFALGIFFPEDNDPAGSSIVLLTTVQQALDDNGFLIREGGSGTFSGYNTSFVKYNNSPSVQLRGYSLRNKKYEIVPLSVGNIVFFFEYDDSLYIQTNELKPARSYIVAVREGNEEIFEQKCQAGQDVVSRWSRDDTRGLFGDDWTIYYTEEPVKGLGGILSAQSDAVQSDAPIIVMRGGIKNNKNCYFINALPYFEIPEKYDPQTVSIDFKLNGDPFDDYDKLYIGNRIILDLYNMPIYMWETGSIDIGLKCVDHTFYTFSIKISGQIIVKNDEYIYKFDRFGRITEDNASFFFYGNHVRTDLKKDTVRGLFRINVREFRYFPEDLYFTNLLAACCFNAERFEITHDKFRKCISYAATRLQIDIQQKEFISNAKALLSSTGILSINYSSGKCQVMPPSFMRVPFSRLQSEGTQLYMLNGCYTRLFIADLYDFCSDNHLAVYAIRNNIRKDEEKLLPPIILLDYRFNPESFSRQYGHQCDVLEDQDFSLSLLNVIPSYREIESQFHFTQKDSQTFLTSFEHPKNGILPGLGFLFGPGGAKIWYIEKSNNRFAEVKSGLLPWASILCHHERNAPMVIINKDHSVFLPATLFLPHYVQRALFMMNLGLPEERKVFVCGGAGNTYYSKMNKYNLYSADRCKLLASKMSGGKDLLVRNKIDVEQTMEFWKRPHRQSDEKYLVLKDRYSVLAVASQFKVYLNDSNRLRRVVARSVNEAMSFIITEKWAFSKDHKSIGLFKNGGLVFDKHFDLTEELLVLPERTGYKVETIEII